MFKSRPLERQPAFCRRSECPEKTGCAVAPAGSDAGCRGAGHRAERTHHHWLGEGIQVRGVGSRRGAAKAGTPASPTGGVLPAVGVLIAADHAGQSTGRSVERESCGGLAEGARRCGWTDRHSSVVPARGPVRPRTRVPRRRDCRRALLAHLHPPPSTTCGHTGWFGRHCAQPGGRGPARSGALALVEAPRIDGRRAPGLASVTGGRARGPHCS